MKKGLPLTIIVFYILASLLNQHAFWYGLPFVLIVLYLLDKEKFINSVFKTDWVSSFKNYYLSIDFVYRRSFWVVFWVLNVVFLYHGVHLIWGDNDWDNLVYNIPPFWQTFIGRFSGGWGHQFLSGHILPVLTNMVAICGAALGGILLAKYWRIRKDFYSVIVFALFAGVCPFILSWFYFLLCYATYLWLPTLVVAAFLIAESTNKENFLAYTLLSVLCLVSALGAYNSVLNTIGVVLLGRIFLLYYFENKSLKEIFIKLKFVFLNIFISFITYILILLYIKIKGYSTFDGYNTRIIEFSEMPQRFLDILIASFKQFFVTFPFIDKVYLNTLFLLVALTFIICLVNAFYKKYGFVKIINLIILIFLMLLSTKIVAFIAESDRLHASRIEYFGLMFFYAFFIALLIKIEIKFFRNILFILMIAILQMSIVRDVEAQKVWKLGNEAEREFFLSIVRKIETNPNFDKNKQYFLVSIRNPEGLRSNYYDYNTFPYKKRSSELLDSSNLTGWNFRSPFRIYAPEIKFENEIVFNKDTNKNDMCNVIKDLRIIIENIKENEVYVDDKYILIAWNADDKDQFLNACKDEQ